MSKMKLKTKRGKETDIFHSYPYYKAPAKMRNDMAFNKTFIDSLSQHDQLLVRGYAQRLVEEKQAFKYKNPNYKRKTTGKGAKYGTSAIAKHVGAWNK